MMSPIHLPVENLMAIRDCFGISARGIETIYLGGIRRQICLRSEVDTRKMTLMNDLEEKQIGFECFERNVKLLAIYIQVGLQVWRHLAIVHSSHGSIYGLLACIQARSSG